MVCIFVNKGQNSESVRLLLCSVKAVLAYNSLNGINTLKVIFIMLNRQGWLKYILRPEGPQSWLSF